MLCCGANILLNFYHNNATHCILNLLRHRNAVTPEPLWTRMLVWSGPSGTWKPISFLESSKRYNFSPTLRCWNKRKKNILLDIILAFSAFTIIFMWFLMRVLNQSTVAKSKQMMMTILWSASPRLLLYYVAVIWSAAKQWIMKIEKVESSWFGKNKHSKQKQKPVRLIFKCHKGKDRASEEWVVLISNRTGGWGTIIYQSDVLSRTSATKHLRHRGLSLTGTANKNRVPFGDRSKIMGSFSESVVKCGSFSYGPSFGLHCCWISFKPKIYGI